MKDRRDEWVGERRGKWDINEYLSRSFLKIIDKAKGQYDILSRGARQENRVASLAAASSGWHRDRQQNNKKVQYYVEFPAFRLLKSLFRQTPGCDRVKKAIRSVWLSCEDGKLRKNDIWILTKSYGRFRFADVARPNQTIVLYSLLTLSPIPLFRNIWSAPPQHNIKLPPKNRNKITNSDKIRRKWMNLNERIWKDIVRVWSRVATSIGTAVASEKCLGKGVGLMSCQSNSLRNSSTNFKDF